jgi:hypothetical protein
MKLGNLKAEDVIMCSLDRFIACLRRRSQNTKNTNACIFVIPEEIKIFCKIFISFSYVWSHY